MNLVCDWKSSRRGEERIRPNGIDAGDVYGYSKLAIQEDTGFVRLRNELGIERGELHVSVLRDMIACQSSSDSISHPYTITSRDPVIDFESMTAEVTVRRHCAFSHQRPLDAHLETGKSI